MDTLYSNHWLDSNNNNALREDIPIPHPLSLDHNPSIPEYTSSLNEPHDIRGNKCIESPSPLTAGSVIVHIVRKEDTLEKLAIQYRSKIADIRRVNHLWSSDSIQSRKEILIPIEQSLFDISNGIPDNANPSFHTVINHGLLTPRLTQLIPSASSSPGSSSSLNAMFSASPRSSWGSLSSRMSGLSSSCSQCESSKSRYIDIDELLEDIDADVQSAVASVIHVASKTPSPDPEQGLRYPPSPLSSVYSMNPPLPSPSRISVSSPKLSTRHIIHHKSPPISQVYYQPHRPGPESELLVDLEPLAQKLAPIAGALKRAVSNYPPSSKREEKRRKSISEQRKSSFDYIESAENEVELMNFSRDSRMAC